jgi:hypothetical protein
MITPKQTRRDKTRSVTQTETTVNASQNDPIQAAEETSLVSDIH